ncbi:MAG: dihydropteroate synthase, partial [Blastocatellia bacterium]
MPERNDHDLVPLRKESAERVGYGGVGYGGIGYGEPSPAVTSQAQGRFARIHSDGGNEMRLRYSVLPVERQVQVMGILNVTPDSFSDGGRYARPEEAIERALEMEAAGADLIDIGGESTRPGAELVSATEELARIVPVLEGL